MPSAAPTNESGGFHPGRAPIDAYGNGGFRFAGMSHKGSLLVLADGIRAWPVAALEQLLPEDFAALFAAKSGIEVVLLGTGAEHRPLPVSLRAAFEHEGLGVEPMSTGAACRTYNILLGEGRAVGAALLAVP